jgi:UDP-N-acetylmuramoyl-tripeptide--D-alanyl-D-alanine ligase
MSITSNKDQLVDLLKADSVGAVRIAFEGLEVDSRKIKGGELFIALRGDQTHGHAFVQQAYDRGAALLLVEDSNLLKNFAEPERILCVPDTLKAFHQIANWWRAKLNLPTLAITGSVGKTTTKELVAAILIQHSLGNYARLSLNNHVGVPYTICCSGISHQWQVLEMGMNHSGEISELSRLAEPNIAMVLKIGAAHIGLLGSLEKIAEAKLEIIAGLKAGGTLILNSDDKILMTAFDPDQLTAKSINKKTFGQEGAPDLKIVSSRLNDSLQLVLNLEIAGKVEQVETRLIGLHNAHNVAAAILAARTLVPDLSWEQIRIGLKNFTPPDGRLKLRRLGPTRVLIDDAYNANPTSMAAMLGVASDLVTQGGKVGLLIGDMLALGELSLKYHQELAALIVAAKPAFVVTVGNEIRATEEILKQSGIAVTTAPNPESAANLIHKLEFNYLLVKASHDIGLEKTVLKLLELEGEMLAPANAQAEEQ